MLGYFTCKFFAKLAPNVWRLASDEGTQKIERARNFSFADTVSSNSNKTFLRAYILTDAKGLLSVDVIILRQFYCSVLNNNLLQEVECSKLTIPLLTIEYDKATSLRLTFISLNS